MHAKHQKDLLNHMLNKKKSIKMSQNQVLFVLYIKADQK
jgi:hypothetical protein